MSWIFPLMIFKSDKGRSMVTLPKNNPVSPPWINVNMKPIANSIGTLAEVASSCGLRALVSSTVSDNETPNAMNADDALLNGQDFIERWKNKNSLITPILGPHAIYSVNLQQLQNTRKIANETNTPISIHLSESQFETQYSLTNYGMTSIKALESINFFDGLTIAAHVVWPTDEEIPILANNKVGVVHNPTSNMKLSSGIE